MIRLTKREKHLAAALAVFFLGWSLFALVIDPAKARIATLKRVIPEKQAELDKLSAAAKEYKFLSDGSRDLVSKAASQRQTIELLPFLESLVQRCGLEKNVAKMQSASGGSPLGTDYSQSIVEIELRALSMVQLVDFLQKVESSDIPGRIGSLYIRKSSARKESLDAVIEIHNPRPAQTKVARQQPS
ncbi:MAG: type II secretion system protein M [Sedimentisphaerales bacterium]|nr:type II secretion system protein M [Sedimentisphaerales bacterium]